MDKLIEKINGLKQALKDIDAKQAAIETEANEKNGGLLDDAQRAAYDAHSAEYDAKVAELASAESDLKRQQDRKARAPISAVNPRKVDPHTMAPLPKGGEAHEVRFENADDVTVIPAGVHRVTNLRHFKGTVNGRTAEERAYRMGMFLLARASHDIPKLYNQKAVDFAREKWGVSSTNGGDGAGVLVPEEFSKDIVDLKETYGVARQLLRRVPMTAERMTVPRRAGGLTVYFVGENAQATESTKEWNDVSLTARKAAVVSRYSKELGMNAVISIADDMVGEMIYSLLEKEDDCCFNGDATSTYGGITGFRTALNAAAGTPTTTSAGGIIVGAGNAYSELTLANFHSLKGILPQYAYGPNTKFVCSGTFYSTVMERLTYAAGGVTGTEVVNGVPMGKFLGYPVVISQKMPTTEANSQVCCLFGDFTKAAMFGDRMRDSVEFSTEAYVNGQSLWERDQIGVKCTEHFDITVHDVGSSTAAGPVVGLQTLNA